MHNVPGQPSHGFRFYIVMITLIVLGIFFLLLKNDDGGFSLTTAAVKSLGSEVPPPGEAAPESEEEPETSEKTARNLAKEVEVKVTFDEVPNVQKEARVEEMTLTFDDLTTNINVNKDKLELNNLKEVTLKVEDFFGKISLNEKGASLDGTAKRLEVNGMALSSKGELKVFFSGLDYNTLSISEIELTDLVLPTGNGQLEVAEKLTYQLEQDELKMGYFDGEVGIDQMGETAVEMKGMARGLEVSGALLNMDLR